MARRGNRLNSNRYATGAKINLPNHIGLSSSASEDDIFSIVTNRNNTFAYDINFNNTSKPDLDFQHLVRGNAHQRKQDALQSGIGKLTRSVARGRDRSRQLQLYEHIIKSGKSGAGTISTVELAKALNAIAQEKGLIPDTAELSLGISQSFLQKALGARSNLQLNKMLIGYIEKIKRGDDLAGLEKWLKIWKNPTAMKIQQETRAIVGLQSKLLGKHRTEIFSGMEMATDYFQYRNSALKSTYSQGYRLGDYGISRKGIVEAAEAAAGINVKSLNASKGRFSGMKLPKGLGKYVLGAAAIGTAGYLAMKTLGISGNDDDYNSIEGLRHGWFGKSRKHITDFGSGFNPTSTFNQSTINQYKSIVSDPEQLALVEKQNEAFHAQNPVTQFQESEHLKIKDYKTLEGMNQKKRNLKEIKLSDYQITVDDADTLVLNKKGKSGLPIQIRMSGIDAPEVVHDNEAVNPLKTGIAQPGGKKATARLKEILGDNKDTRLFIDPNDLSYGRHIGVVFKGNKNVNLQLVEEGYVSSLEYGPAHKDAVDRAIFMAAGEKAEKEERGIWGLDFFKDWKAFSAGAGKDTTFNSLTDILRLAKNRYLAEGVAEMREDGVNEEESYRKGALYQMTNQWSGKDGDYNTIQGLKHGWYGKQRKDNTDFGSGFKPDRVGQDLFKEKMTGIKSKKKREQDYVEATPLNYGLLTKAGLSFGAARYLWNKDVDIPFYGKKNISDLSYMGHSSETLGRTQAKYKDLAYNAVRRFEFGFGGMPKAFSVSTLMSPSILQDTKHVIDFGMGPIDPAMEALQRSAQSMGGTDPTGMRQYIMNLTGHDAKSFGITSDGAFTPFNKAVFENGQLFGVTNTGEYKSILKEAKLYQNIHDGNVTGAGSQFTKAYMRMMGVESIGSGQTMMVGGGNTKIQSMIRTGHAFAKETLNKYLNLMDDPGKFMRDLSPSLAPVSKVVDKFSSLMPKLGTGSYGRVGNIWKDLGRHAMTMLPKAAGLAFAVGTANWMVRKLAPEDTVAGKAGLTGIAAEGGRLAHMTYARVSESTGLTDLRKYAEERAPGLTGFKPWLGFALSGMITGSALGMAANVVQEARAPAGALRYAQFLKSKEASRMMPKLLQKIPGLGGKYTRVGKWGRVGALAMGLAAAPFLMFGMGSKKSVKELDEEYLNKKEVAVKKARWWEFGTTPWEGEKTMYYRPNWYNRILDRPTAKSLYGDEDISPVGKFVRSLADPYWLEKKHYKDRPYPIAGYSAEWAGPFAPLVESSLGRILKPTVYMHTDEIGRGGYHGKEGAHRPSKNIPGGLAPEEAISPYSLKEQIKQQFYTGYEAAGLRGFTLSAIKQAITGEQDLYEHTPVLQSSADMDSIRREFWDLNMGGFGGLTEPIRRMIPKRQYTTEIVNPLKNTMPDWMPGSNYYTDFKTGDPYTKIAEGEYRLPGTGYEARYKELKGLDPEKYPLIHQYKILADVAPHSKEFREARKSLNDYEPTDYELKIFLETEKQLEDKRTKKRFRDDVYDESMLGRYGAALSDIARANPLEQLTPLAPAHKFGPAPRALSSYEESIYGKEFKLWQRPIDDFLKPAITTAGNIVGLDAIPDNVQETRKVEQYFDELQYVKSMKLEQEALRHRADSKARGHAQKALTTIAGVDPYANDYKVLASLPKREKVYFQEFADAPMEDRERILELAPDNMKDLYIARWDKMLLNQMNAEDAQISSEDKAAAEEQIFNRMVNIRAKRKAESQALLQSERVPADDWIGWRADVDMEDVKLKFLVQSGRDYHNYDLWDDRLRSLRRKPYLEGVADELSPLEDISTDITYLDVYKQAIDAGVTNPSIMQKDGAGGSVSYDLEYNRDQEMHEELRGMGQVI